MHRAGLLAPALAAALAASLTTCRTGLPGEIRSGDAGITGTATVFAAASLTEAFTDIQAAFETANPGVSIAINFGSSSGLATQIVEQGGAHVYAPANTDQMERVAGSGLTATEPQVFARTELQVIVQTGNPHHIGSLADLANPDLKVVLAAPQVPVGVYARQVLQRAGVTVEPVSEATDVKGVVAPVVLGEADAGIVYATDVSAAGAAAEGVAIPSRFNVVASFPIALIRGAEDNEVAAAFVDYVLGPRGKRILSGFGFGTG